MTEVQGDTLPKSGRVNEVCKEWLVREDGALAYRLQTKEISEHYSGNKHRNALVREDLPKAREEQLREKQEAEHRARLYHDMINEQEQADAMVARQLAEKLEREERERQRAAEERDQQIARRLQQERDTQYERQQQQQQPQRVSESKQQQSSFSESRRHGQKYPMPGSSSYHVLNAGINHEPYILPNHLNGAGIAIPPDAVDYYNENPAPGLHCSTNPSFNATGYSSGGPPGSYPGGSPGLNPGTSPSYRGPPPPPPPMELISENRKLLYRHNDLGLPESMNNTEGVLEHRFERNVSLNDTNDVAGSTVVEFGHGVDLESREFDERLLQEQKDAELARQLQEQEGSATSTQLDRDRLIAIEAQDQELARLLQERERAKAKRAKERARQRALAKKQNMTQPDPEAGAASSSSQQQPPQITNNSDRLEDSYSNPVDLISPLTQQSRDDGQYPVDYNYTEPLNFQPQQQSTMITHTGKPKMELPLTRETSGNNQYVGPKYEPKSFMKNGVCVQDTYSDPLQLQDEVNYSYPVDSVPPLRKQQQHGYNASAASGGRNYNPETQLQHVNAFGKSNFGYESDKQLNVGYHKPDLTDILGAAVRPNHLDIRGSINKPAKPRYPDPESSEIAQGGNIAAAIDPTYNPNSLSSHGSRETSFIYNHRSSPSKISTSGSPAHTMSPTDLSEYSDDSPPAPPYMPIQGQRRTSSLEKKKKKSKDGCKQQ